VRRFRLRGVRLTPSLVISTLALFVALAGTGVAANVVPLAKKALTANKAKVADVAKNAQKLNGQTAGQVASIPGPATDAATLNGQTAAQIAATPGPAASLPVSLFTIRSIGWSIQNEGNTTEQRALCGTGERAVAGGWDIANGLAAVKYDRPMDAGAGWWFRIFADSGNTVPANGSVWVVCAKAS
jgi:hypothetical protein